MEEHHETRNRLLRPIREEVGYPLDDADGDAFYDLGNDVVMEYVAALESAYVGSHMAIREVAKSIRRIPNP